MGPPESHSASVSQAIEPTPPRVGGAEVAVADTHALICTLCNSGLEVGVLPINPMGPGNNRKQFRFNMLGGGGGSVLKHFCNQTEQTRKIGGKMHLDVKTISEIEKRDQSMFYKENDFLIYIYIYIYVYINYKSIQFKADC